MRNLLYTVFFLSIFGAFNAQLIELRQGQYEGQNIHQKEIDSLFIRNPHITLLDIHYVEPILQLPAFDSLGILAIHSETLNKLTFSASISALEIIDIHAQELQIFDEVPFPQLYQLTLYAQLDSLPTFICSSPELKLVDIQNYKNISRSESVEDRFTNGDFEISSLEIQNEIDGEMLSKMVSQDLTEEILEDDYPMIEEEIKQATQKSLRRIALFRRSLGFVLSGIFFLIWVR